MHLVSTCLTASSKLSFLFESLADFLKKILPKVFFCMVLFWLLASKIRGFDSVIIKPQLLFRLTEC